MCVMSRKQFWTKLVFIIKYLLIIWLNVCKNIVNIVNIYKDIEIAMSCN